MNEVQHHRVVIVLESNNGHEYPNHEIEKIVQEFEQKGFTGSWKRVSDKNFSLAEKGIETFKNFIDFMRG